MAARPYSGVFLSKHSMNSESSKNERIRVYIDGSNFYFKMKSPPLQFRNLIKFNYHGLCHWLARGRALVGCNYYIGVVRADFSNTKGQQLRKEQQKLFAHLRSAEQGFTIKRGYLMNNNGVYHEKGVDVQMAVDLLSDAYDNLYDTAILISSDTDLIPAIKKVIRRGKQVEYIGFSHQPSLALQKCATLSRLLIKDEVQPFIAQ